MAYLLGVVLFALAIFVSVCLHEAGHMATAKAFGMKVSRYFAGFGPTIFSFRRGETEYGLKAIPLGGFVKIVGMTPQDDDVEPGDEHRAMWRFPVWKRTIVMSAGSVTHFILGVVLMWITVSFVGIPNPALDKGTALPAYITVQQCIPVDPTRTTCQPGDPSPAKDAGLHTGDKITAIGPTQVSSYDDLVRVIRDAKPGPTPVTYQRDGQTQHVTVDLGSASLPPINDPNGTPSKVAVLGVSQAVPPGVPLTVTYGPVDGVGQAFNYTGRTFAGIGSAIKNIPGKVPGLWRALSGQPRDPNGPISVVGASRLGGETVEHHAWFVFLMLAASLNLFIGVFNLLPLLPLDGGHIAIAWFERLRSWFYRRIGRRDPGRVDYLKLMPVTYVVILIFGGFTVLTIAADIVNPVTLFGK